MNTGRYYGIAAGTQTAGLYAGGYFQRPETEEYNGSTWSNGPNMINCRYAGQGAGKQYAAFFQGGAQGVIPSALENCTEEYNGSSWSAGGATSTRFSFGSATGTSNSGLVFGGYPTRATTEEYNGSSWSSGGNLITGRCFASGAGTQNATVAAGGRAPGRVSCVEEYNGTSWSAETSLPAAQSRFAAAGSQTSSIFSHGFPSTISVLIYNGSTWSAGAYAPTNLSNRQGFGCVNRYTVAGSSGSPTSQTEEYNI
jgi:hypothetical protein